MTKVHARRQADQNPRSRSLVSYLDYPQGGEFGDGGAVSVRQYWVPEIRAPRWTSVIMDPVRQVHASHCEVMALTASLFIGSILELFRLPTARHGRNRAACEGYHRARTRGWSWHSRLAACLHRRYQQCRPSLNQKQTKKQTRNPFPKNRSCLPRK